MNRTSRLVRRMAARVNLARPSQSLLDGRKRGFLPSAETAQKAIRKQRSCCVAAFVALCCAYTCKHIGSSHDRCNDTSHPVWRQSHSSG